MGWDLDGRMPQLHLPLPPAEVLDQLYHFLDYPQKLFNWFARLAVTRDTFFGTVVVWAHHHREEAKRAATDTANQLDYVLVGALYDAYDENWEPRPWYFSTYALTKEFVVSNQPKSIQVKKLTQDQTSLGLVTNKLREIEWDPIREGDEPAMPPKDPRPLFVGSPTPDPPEQFDDFEAKPRRTARRITGGRYSRKPNDATQVSNPSSYKRVT